MEALMDNKKLDNKKSDLEKFKENVEQYHQGEDPDSRNSAEDEITRSSKPGQKPTATDESRSR
jgi:hypothetical protein